MGSKDPMSSPWRRRFQGEYERRKHQFERLQSLWEGRAWKVRYRNLNG